MLSLGFIRIRIKICNMLFIMSITPYLLTISAWMLVMKVINSFTDKNIQDD